jgi:hypothetical protein
MASYDTVTIGAGQTREWVLSDGETLENLLIDISASNAEFRIIARSANWEIRNIGVRGVWNDDTKQEPIVLETPSGSTGIVQNFYWADGIPDDVYPGVTGFFVPHTHAGTIKFDRCNLSWFPDNSWYASGPGQTDEYGHSGGAGGQIHITNSYAEGSRSAHFRIGSDGSFVRNCVAVGGDRGLIGRFENIEAYDSDFTGGRFGSVVAGSPGWQKHASTHATITLENCRWDTEHKYYGTNQINGESVGSDYRTSPPHDCPETAEDAASSTQAMIPGKTGPLYEDGTGGGTGDDGDTGDGGGDTGSRRVFEIIAPSGSNVEYTFTATGDVSKHDASDTVGSIGESNDVINVNDDGTVSVSGSTGNGYGDAFLVGGEITSFTTSTGNVTTRIDGSEIDPSQIGTGGTGDDGTDDGTDDGGITSPIGGDTSAQLLFLGALSWSSARAADDDE